MTRYGVADRPTLSEIRSPAGLGRLRVGAWLAATAFSGSGAGASVVFPSVLLAFAAQGVESVHVSSNRAGVFVLAPHRPGRTWARLFALFAVLLVPAVAVTVCLQIWPVLPIALIAMAVTSLTLVGLMIILLSSLSVLLRAGAPTSPIGTETPSGPRMVLSALAQLPGSGSSVVFEVRSAIRALPPGTVVVAVARTEELANSYARLGFSRGEGKRVFFVVDSVAY